MAAGTRSDDERWVICLCADWCGVCQQWRALFDEAAAAHAHIRFAWVDIEDEADAMGDVDVETFPTLLIARGSQPLFLGPVQPTAAQVSRLVEALLDDDDRAGRPNAAVPLEAAPLLARLAAGVLPKA
jgi:hypothetical protein